MDAITIQTIRDEKEFLESDLIEKKINYTKVESSQWDGEQLVSYLIEISPLIITSIATIIVQNMRAKRHVKIITDGVEIHGVSESNIKGILEKIYESKQSGKSKKAK